MFFRPDNSVAADVIPFYRNGTYQLFYLRDYRNTEIYGEGTGWELIETQDFVHFEEKGEVITKGSEQDQDLYVYTGCAFMKDEVSYLFYTGHNPYFTDSGRSQEVILRAVSRDCIKWEKDLDFCLHAPACFEVHDFRDPFIFYHEERREYCMLLAARKKNGSYRRSGCTAIATSKDLNKWTVLEEPFYAPDMYYTHECPDLFQMGEWWYLVFSEFTDKFETHYRMSRSWNGPWVTPQQDTFDNRSFYAAKTVSDGKNRFIIGWNPTNCDNRDFSELQWGGNIVVHQIVQGEDGKLFVKIPDTVKEAYPLPQKYQVTDTTGIVKEIKNGWEIGRVDGYSGIDLSRLCRKCRFSFDVTFYGKGLSFFICLKSGELCYSVEIDTGFERMVFDRWPRKRNDHPFILESERKISVKENERYHMELIRDDSVLEIYLDDRYAMSARMNEDIEGVFGFAVSYGVVRVEGLKYLLPEDR